MEGSFLYLEARKIDLELVIEVGDAYASLMYLVGPPDMCWHSTAAKGANYFQRMKRKRRRMSLVI